MDLRSHHRRIADGVSIVLTASAIEMSDFDLDPFVSFSGGFPLGIIPKSILRREFYPPIAMNSDGTARFAPYGLRKVEALLIEEFGEENVVTVHPFQLDEFVGPRTKVVGISTMDPLGLGFVSRTYTGILGLHGKPATQMEFETLLSNEVLKDDGLKILVGGSGAWQLSNQDLKASLGIDTVILGQTERSVVDIFKRAMNEEELEEVIESESPDMNKIPTIRRPSIYGTVEITRGCGRGCHFCSPTTRNAHSFPLKHILEEVKLNASNGSRMIIIQTDDLFLYRSRPNFVPNAQAIIKLIRSISQTNGVEFIQVAHASFPPIVCDPRIVEEIGPILLEKSVWKYGNGERCASVEMGIETGSTRLIETYMKGKPLPFEPERWQEIVIQTTGLLNDFGVYPLVTLVLGLPGEKDEDVRETIELLDKLKGSKIFYVPLLFVSERGTGLDNLDHMDVHRLRPPHWEILSTCWTRNLDKWEPSYSPLTKIACSLPRRARVGALLLLYALAKKLEKRNRAAELAQFCESRKRTTHVSRADAQLDVSHYYSNMFMHPVDIS